MKIFSSLSVLLLAIVVLSLELVYVPSSLDRLLADNLLTNSYPAIKASISYEPYVLFHLGLRCLVNALFWIAAVIVYLQTRKQSTALARMGLLTSALLISLPIPFLWSSILWASSFPDPLQTILSTANGLLSILALMLLLFFYFLFPSGRFQPAWLAWPVGIFSLLIVGIFSLMFTGQFEGDQLWLIGFLAYFFGLLAGLISLWLRWQRQPRWLDQPFGEEAQINQPAGLATWLVLAVSTLPLAFIISSFLDKSPSQYFLSSIVQFVFASLLPAALILAIFRGELWSAFAVSGQVLPPTSARRKAATVLALLSVIGIASFLIAARKTELAPEKKLAFQKHFTDAPLPTSAAPRPVVIDTDMAYDDWLAILYVLQRPELSVKAITVNGTGESHCEPGVRNALALIRLAGHSNIPVACGREIPLQGQHVFPAEWRQDSDSLNGLVLPDGENAASQTNSKTMLTAPELLQHVVQNSSEKVTLLTLGALTNIAEAVQQDPGFLKNLSQIYIMGGALEVLGNVGYSGIDNQVAEWNIFIDPLALKILLDAGAPITLVPLDATNQVPANLDFYRLLQANQSTPEARFVTDLLVSELDLIATGINSFWDPLTAAIMVDESLGTIRRGNLKVYTQEGPSSGLTRLMSDGAPVRYVKSVDSWRFYADFLRTLNQP